MSENIDFDKEGREAAENEGVRETTPPPEAHIEQEKNEALENDEIFVVNFAESAQAGVEALNKGMIELGGEAAKLKEKERAELDDLINRGSKLFGLKIEIQGKKGFLAALGWKLVNIIGIRLLNPDVMDNLLKKLEKNKQQKKQEEPAKNKNPEKNKKTEGGEVIAWDEEGREIYG